MCVEWLGDITRVEKKAQAAYTKPGVYCARDRELEFLADGLMGSGDCFLIAGSPE